MAQPSNRRARQGPCIDGDTFQTAIAGASEADLVNSGLEDTMMEAWQQIGEAAQRHQTDPRTAAYIIAIEKIATSYLSRGIFP
jgi:glutamate dehydrogenase (NAD(P)+)